MLKQTEAVETRPMESASEWNRNANAAVPTPKISNKKTQMVVGQYCGGRALTEHSATSKTITTTAKVS